MKYIFVSLRVRNGEYEYSSKGVHTLKKKQSVDKFVEDYAKNFYGKGSHENENGWYFSHNGEVAVSVNYFRLITKEEFDVLDRFL